MNRIESLLSRRRPLGRGTVSLGALGMTGLAVGLLTTGISAAGAARAVPTCTPNPPVSPLCQVDPGTVPQGELALESTVTTPFTIDVAGHEKHFGKGAEVTVEHFQFAPAGDANHFDVSGWHKHGGPVFVMVLTGTLTVYQGNDEKCKGKQYPAGTGFVEPGGVVHDARNEGSVPVDIYDTVMLPPGTGDAGIFIPTPNKANSDCPFPQ